MFSLAFFKKALENSLVAGLSAFAASGVFTGTPSLKGVVTGATAAGMAVVYTFIKNYGGVQVAKAAATSAK